MVICLLGLVRVLGGLYRERRKEFEKLEQRVRELEGRTAMKYAGVWSDSELYRPGDVVTHGGTAWHCNEDNNGARPGASKVWQLMVKSFK